MTSLVSRIRQIGPSWAVLVILLLVTSGCLYGQDAELSEDDRGPKSGSEPNEPDNGAGQACQDDVDCVLAASTCCECPSFAALAGEGYDAGCDNVQCEPQGLCPAVAASCQDQQCIMVCSAIVTDQICSFGFATDEAGCLLNQCSSAPTSVTTECQVNTDCVQIPADCCGCGQGGNDTAVPLGLAGFETDDLNCPSDPACPGIDVCNTEEVAQCIAGSCALAVVPSDPGVGETVLCGTPELPTCPEGSACVLNDISANDASLLGVGSCVVL